MFSDPIKNLAELDVQDGMKVADIGAGSGFYSIEAAKKVGARGLVYAVDVQQDLLERLKKSAALVGLHNIEIIWGNAEKIGGTKLRENIADRVIVSNVLFQIEPKDRDNFVLELKRIVKPGGKLLVVDWQSGSPLTPPTAVPVMTAEALFQKAGWTLEKNFDAGDHHYGIIFKKP
jgi:ubiquinone/menaquinone biosynthesis C-methylase UbiE